MNVHVIGPLEGGGGPRCFLSPGNSIPPPPLEAYFLCLRQSTMSEHTFIPWTVIVPGVMMYTMS